MDRRTLGPFQTLESLNRFKLSRVWIDSNSRELESIYVIGGNYHMNRQQTDSGREIRGMSRCQYHGGRNMKRVWVALCNWKTLTSWNQLNRVAQPVSHKASKISTGIKTRNNTWSESLLWDAWGLIVNYHGEQVTTDVVITTKRLFSQSTHQPFINLAAQSLSDGDAVG